MDFPLSANLSSDASSTPAISGTVFPDNSDETVVTHTSPVFGKVDMQPDGSYLYQANANFTGTDTFTYTTETGEMDVVVVDLSPSKPSESPTELLPEQTSEGTDYISLLSDGGSEIDSTVYDLDENAHAQLNSASIVDWNSLVDVEDNSLEIYTQTGEEFDILEGDEEISAASLDLLAEVTPDEDKAEDTDLDSVYHQGPNDPISSTEETIAASRDMGV